ncbi:MAG TPA: IclR family transcriptional regulator [Rhodothermales bacterium]|nr:IclR family transcriptional regulator [Rhodothermales bacterium]
MPVADQTSKNQAKPARTQRGIQSIEVGGRLLSSLTQSAEPMSLKDLAQASEMPAAKAHPYLVSFGKLGLVEQDPRTSRYELGPLALQMGLTCLRRLNPVRLGAQTVSELATTTHQTAALAVWGNAGPTIVHIEESTHPVHVNMRTGTVMSLFNTATGRVFATWLPQEVIEQHIALATQQAIAYPESDERSSWDDMRSTLLGIRKRGMARVIGEPLPGINALSAPVFDHQGRLSLVVTLFGPNTHFDPSWEGKIAAALRQCCDGLSHRLGSQDSAQNITLSPAPKP